MKNKEQFAKELEALRLQAIERGISERQSWVVAKYDLEDIQGDDRPIEMLQAMSDFLRVSL